MRIALFSEVYWPMVSGVGVTLVRLVDALEARGHAVRVYSASYPPPDGQADRPEVHRSPSIPLFIYPDVQWAFPRVRDVIDDVAAFRPDIVHVATEFALGLAGLRAARHLQLPLIASAHTDYEVYASRYGLDWVLRAGWHYLRWFYGQADRVLCPSRIYEDHLNRRGVHHTGIWTRGVDRQEFNPWFRNEEYRRAIGVGPEDLLITYAGRLAREKNISLLLDAWERLAAERNGVKLLLLGKGPLEDEIRRRGVPSVHLAGLKRGEELATAYASSDVFVFPSPTETFGNALLEAMASGLPSVVAAGGGVLEFARHGNNAWLVAPDDADALLDGMHRLLDDAGLRRSLGQGGLETAEGRGWDVVYEQLLGDYGRVVGGKRVRAA